MAITLVGLATLRRTNSVPQLALLLRRLVPSARVDVTSQFGLAEQIFQTHCVEWKRVPQLRGKICLEMKMARAISLESEATQPFAMERNEWPIRAKLNAIPTIQST